MAPTPDDDRLVAFTKTVESAITKQLKDLVEVELQRIDEDHNKRVEVELQRVKREKQQLLETAKTAISTAISRETLEGFARSFLDPKPEEATNSLSKVEQVTLDVTKTSTPPATAPAKFTAKRSKSQPDFGNTSKRLRTSTGPPARQEAKHYLETVDVHDWEVEGTEYIFELQEFNTGWIVLRCHLGDDTPSHTFTEHPFTAPKFLAESHFNEDHECNGHDHVEEYSKEDIVKEFGHKVVDSEGYAPSVAWVESSNARLFENQFRKSRKAPQPQRNLLTYDFD